MKKLLGILVLGLLWCNTSFADGTDEDVDKRILYQTARSTIKDF